MDLRYVTRMGGAVVTVCGDRAWSLTLRDRKRLAVKREGGSESQPAKF